MMRTIVHAVVNLILGPVAFFVCLRQNWVFRVFAFEQSVYGGGSIGFPEFVLVGI